LGETKKTINGSIFQARNLLPHPQPFHHINTRMKMNILGVVVLVLCLKTVVGNQDSFEQSESFDFARANSTQEGKNATWAYFVNENNGTISEEESENNGTYNEYQPEERNASWTHTIEENNGTTITEDNSDYNSTFYEIQLEQNDTVIDQIGMFSIIYDGVLIYRLNKHKIENNEILIVFH